MKTTENGKEIEPIIKWEHRANRKCVLPQERTNVHIFYDWMLKMPIQHFHGCGLLLPLYSIRSNQSYQGMGEFMDLKLLIDLCKKSNQLMIQLLPLQDTILALDGTETNQSLQVSAFAFNPVYLTIRKIEGFQENFLKTIRRKDMITIYIQKMQALHQIFSSVDRNKLRNDNDFIAFVQRNRYWIYYYCTWANIRDDWLNQNPLNSRKKEDHLEPSFPSFVSDQIIDFLNPKDKENETPEEIGCLFQAWVQYQCHLQLKEVSEYAQENRIVLACSLTIGQRHKGSDVWAHEEIFNSKRMKPIKNRWEMKNMVQNSVNNLVFDKFRIEPFGIEQIENDNGAIIEKDDELVGVYKDITGKIYAVKPICSHLGCLLSWNNTDKTWDCPCHGSRFDYNGKNLYEPAIKGLDIITKI